MLVSKEGNISTEFTDGDHLTTDVLALKDRILDILDATKATDVLTIDLRGKATMGEYMVIASGSSARQLSAIADKLTDELKPELSGFKIRVEGRSKGDWVLLDFENVIVHLFRPEVREFYALEKIWAVPASASEPDLTQVSA